MNQELSVSKKNLAKKKRKPKDFKETRSERLVALNETDKKGSGASKENSIETRRKGGYCYIAADSKIDMRDKLKKDH